MSSETSSVPRIVVGVDGSESSKAALLWAVHQAELTGGAVEAVIAWERPLAWYALAAPGSGSYDFGGLAGGYLGRVIDSAIGPDRQVEIRPRTLEGHPAAVLLDAARGARLLVVGGRGHGGFGEAVLGSVSQHCVQHAPCPVVVVRGHEG
ncbi:universal stress protein [Streptomyces sp. SID13666]|uniref:universal stress protein n=1 Tax=unclassified Streptomyces TaxID=2593676 RepID=UPI0013C1C31B|nr:MULTISPECIES: universal stress protein [unclassified Streptomyces]MCZ4098921.1 universal stress protein [Streptomyces sp. H39-C1]NEA60112.1 universal stress protein [Streptomyces sp. SID13666]